MSVSVAAVRNCLWIIPIPSDGWATGRGGGGRIRSVATPRGRVLGLVLFLAVRCEHLVVAALAGPFQYVERSVQLS